MYPITPHKSSPDSDGNTDLSRRNFITSIALATLAVGVTTSTANASIKYRLSTHDTDPLVHHMNFPWIGP